MAVRNEKRPRADVGGIRGQHIQHSRQPAARARFFGLKVEGVASGTLTAQWLGALTGLGIVAVKYRPAPGRLREIIRLSDLKRFFKSQY